MGFIITGKPELFKGAPKWATKVLESDRMLSSLRVWSNGEKYQYIAGYEGGESTQREIPGRWPFGGITIAERYFVEDKPKKVKTARKKGAKKTPKAVSKLEIRYVLGEKYVIKNPIAMHITQDSVLIALEAKGQIGVDDVVVQKNVRIERSSLSAIVVSDAKTGYSSVIYFDEETAKEFTHGHSRDILTAEYIFN